MAAPILFAQPGSDATLGGAPILSNFTITGLADNASLDGAVFELDTVNAPAGDALGIVPNDHVSLTLLPDGGYQVLYDGVDVGSESFPVSGDLRLTFSVNATVGIAQAVVDAIALTPDASSIDIARQYMTTFALQGADAASTGHLGYNLGSSAS